MATKNYFALLDEDAGEPPAKVEASAKSSQTKESVTSKPEDQKRPRGSRTDYPRRGGSTRGPVVVHENTVLKERNGPVNPPITESQLHDIKDAAGHRGGRSGRGGRGGNFRGREFDRHSANPRHDGEKKEVAGKGSWGNPLTAEEEASKDLVDGGAKDTAPEGDVRKAPEPEPEPEEKVKSLQDYLAERAQTKPSAATVQRKPNEGSDDSQWKDAIVFEKKEEEEFLSSALKTTAKPKKAKDVQKKVLEIEQKFADEAPPPRDSFRGDRGGRGGGRGGFRGSSDRPRGGRSGFQAGGRGPAPINVEDKVAFPTLGSK